MGPTFQRLLWWMHQQVVATLTNIHAHYYYTYYYILILFIRLFWFAEKNEGISRGEKERDKKNASQKCARKSGKKLRTVLWIHFISDMNRWKQFTTLSELAIHDNGKRLKQTKIY